MDAHYMSINPSYDLIAHLVARRGSLSPTSPGCPG
jgi:hypothetical protein